MAQVGKKYRTFQEQIENATLAELETLKDKLFSEMTDALGRTYQCKDSMNMKVRSIGRKVMRVAAVLYPEGSEEFTACREKVHRLTPHYRKRTEEEKNDQIVERMLNELETPSYNYISEHKQVLAARQLYISAEKAKGRD